MIANYLPVGCFAIDVERTFDRIWVISCLMTLSRRFQLSNMITQ